MNIRFMIKIYLVGMLMLTSTTVTPRAILSRWNALGAISGVAIGTQFVALTKNYFDQTPKDQWNLKNYLNFMNQKASPFRASTWRDRPLLCAGYVGGAGYVGAGISAAGLCRLAKTGTQVIPVVKSPTSPLPTATIPQPKTVRSEPPAHNDAPAPKQPGTIVPPPQKPVIDSTITPQPQHANTNNSPIDQSIQRISANQEDLKAWLASLPRNGNNAEKRWSLERSIQTLEEHLAELREQKIYMQAQAQELAADNQKQRQPQRPALRRPPRPTLKPRLTQPPPPAAPTITNATAEPQPKPVLSANARRAQVAAATLRRFPQAPQG